MTQPLTKGVVSGGQTMNYETDPCGCIYVVGGGDFVGDPDSKVQRHNNEHRGGDRVTHAHGSIPSMPAPAAMER